MAFDSANRAAVRVQAAWRGHACRRRTVHRARRRFLKIAALLDTSAHAAAVLSGDALCRVEFPRSATLCRPVLAPRPPAPPEARPSRPQRAPPPSMPPEQPTVTSPRLGSAVARAQAGGTASRGCSLLAVRSVLCSALAAAAAARTERHGLPPGPRAQLVLNGPAPPRPRAPHRRPRIPCALGAHAQ